VLHGVTRNIEIIPLSYFTGRKRAGGDRWVRNVDRKQIHWRRSKRRGDNFSPC